MKLPQGAALHVTAHRAPTSSCHAYKRPQEQQVTGVIGKPKIWTTAQAGQKKKKQADSTWKEKTTTTTTQTNYAVPKMKKADTANLLASCGMNPDMCLNSSSLALPQSLQAAQSRHR